MYYILENGLPLEVDDVLTWARWFENHENRRVAETSFPNKEIQVSTVFLGIDHSFLPNVTPVLFETMVFGGTHDGEMDRYCTLEQAMHGHERMVALVEADLER